MKSLITFVLRELLDMPVVHNVKLAPYDRFNTMLSSFSNKLKYTKHVPMISYSHGFHPIFFSFFEKARDIGSPVEK